VATPGELAAAAAKRFWYARIVLRSIPRNALDLSLAGAGVQQRGHQWGVRAAAGA